MYNASDDWDKDPAERKFDQLAGQPVKFVWYSDYGFDGTLKITSASGDDVPYEYVTDDEDFGTCWLCIMPAEPITIETVGTEKTTFAGRAFVGYYKGFPILVGDNGVLQSAEPTLNLAANSSFHATVSGEKTFGGCYTFNDATNRFSYDDADSFDFLRAEILAYERQSCQRYRVHRVIYKSVKLTRDGVCRHVTLRKRVYRCLNENVGYREYAPLKPRGKSDFRHLLKLGEVYSEFFHIEPCIAVAL